MKPKQWNLFKNFAARFHQEQGNTNFCHSLPIMSGTFRNICTAHERLLASGK
jgi:hypothetical protein